MMSRSRTWVVCGAIALLVSLSRVLWLQRRHSAADAEHLALEPLVATRASCPEQRDHGAHAAHVALHVAQARMQRYAFAPGEGRLALDRIAVAVECARLAGDEALAATASQRESQLRERIEREARDRLRRYEILKRHDRLPDAAGDIAFLIELGWPARGALAEALRRDRDALESAP